MKRTSLHRLRRLKRAMLCGLVRGYPSLQSLLPTATPLDVRRFCSGNHAELMVFLPGIGDLTDDFELNGFIAALRDSARPAEISSCIRENEPSALSRCHQPPSGGLPWGNR